MRLRTPSLRYTALTCFLTVLSEMKSAAAISRLVWPANMSSSTSASRGLSPCEEARAWASAPPLVRFTFLRPARSPSQAVSARMRARAALACRAASLSMRISRGEKSPAARSRKSVIVPSGTPPCASVAVQPK